jgi:hypothetical protein
MLMGNYLLGTLTWFASAAAVILLYSGVIQNIPQSVYVVYWASFVLWLGSYALSGWLNSARHPDPERPAWAEYAWRAGQALVSVVLAPVTATFSIGVGLLCFYLGDPQDFEVIAKTEETAKKDVGRPAVAEPVAVR